MNNEQNQTRPSDCGDLNCGNLGCGDLDWMAFQYIAGELPAAEVEAFDERLAIDQDAREAVVRAMHLAEATALAFASAPVVTLPAKRLPRSFAWVAGGVAAAVAIIVTLAGWLQSPSHTGGNNVQIVERHGEVRELAMAWATGWTDLAATELAADVSDSTEEALAGMGADGEEVESIETPSWMFIAVAGLTQNATDQGEQGLE
jgi:hypothetical protein